MHVSAIHSERVARFIYPLPVLLGRARCLVLALVFGLVGTWPFAAIAQAPTQGAADQDESALLVADARVHLARGDYERAGRSLDRALSLNPRRIDIYVLRASVHAALEQYPAGLALLRQARELAPDSVDVLTALGSQLLLAGQRAEGVPLLVEVVDRFPERYDAHILLGYHYAEQGAPGPAIGAFERYFQTRPGSLQGEDSTHQLALADVYLRAGRRIQARDLFMVVRQAEPRNLTARLGLAWATAAIDCRQALPLLIDLEDLSARYPDIDVVRGHCELALGMVTESKQRARGYLRENPGSASAQALLGEARMASGDLDGARTSLRTALTLDPSLRHVALRLARAEREAGDPEAALAVLDQLGPASDNTAADLAWSIERSEALIVIGRAGDAAALLASVLESAPARGGDAARFEAREVLGVALYRTGDMTAATAELERALVRRPDSKRGRTTLADALALTGNSHIQAGQLSAAREAFERAVEVQPEPRTWRNLGVIRLAQGDADGALGPLAQAADAGDGVARHLQARALGQVGKIEQARQAFAAASRGRRDPVGQVMIAIDLASFELANDEPGRAVDALERVEKFAGDDTTARQALVTARYAAGRAALSAGAGARALGLLVAAEANADSNQRRDIRCHLVLAALHQGDRRKALSRLQALKRADARCQFDEATQRVAIPVLESLALGLNRLRAGRDLSQLVALHRRSRGPARTLVAEAVRVLATNASLNAYNQGRLLQAERHLAVTAQVEKPKLSLETRHNQAAISIARGRNMAGAIAALQSLVARVPEALVNLGVAYDRRSEPLQALGFYERASARRVRFGPLADWIASKRRVFGEQP